MPRRFRYQIALGELPGSWPSVAFGEVDPFMDPAQYAEANLSVSVTGLTGLGQGHHVATDSGYYSQLPIDQDIPLSPLFCRDLAGRVVYLGPGPEIKGNDEWVAYQAPENGGEGSTESVTPFAPFVVFPRHCRDVPNGAENVPEAALLEDVLLCHFRALEEPRRRRYLPSGAALEDDMQAVPYFAPNLYPYKLRLDTFYPDGYRLPQTQMVFARGGVQGADPEHAHNLGQSVLQAWDARPAEMDYAAWFEALGEAQIDDLFAQGCTLIPTFEAFNGCAVVGRDFSLQEYWPGRAVAGLHELVELREDNAPRGTILEVLRPGFVTATRIIPAQVIASDGSGYVSPNAADPEPLIPNLNLPHSRTAPNWRGCHLPTHPQHFEVPALFGFEPESGKFLQISGPLWAPLYYVYGCTDAIIDAYDFPEPHPSSANHCVVPPELKGRFWPMVPLQGFDTFDLDAVETRRTQGSKLRTMIVRDPSDLHTAGVAYHPLPLEFEFECEPFWFPALHPLNREHGLVPPDLADRLAPVISPTVMPETFIASIRGQGLVLCPWLTEVSEMLPPAENVIEMYPGLMRYLLPNMDIDAVMRWALEPMLGNLEDIIREPAARWWADFEGETRDSAEDLQIWAGGQGAALHTALWDMREASVQLTKFRHTMFQVNPTLYSLAHWFGVTPLLMQEMFLEDIANAEAQAEKMEKFLMGEEEAPTDEASVLAATPPDNTAEADEENLTPEEKAQMRAIQAMASAREKNRLVAEQASGAEDTASAAMLKTL